MDKKPQKFGLECLNVFEQFAVYLYQVMGDRNGSAKWRFVWDDKVVEALMGCEIDLHKGNNGSRTSRRLALGQAERKFYSLLLLIRRGRLLGLVTPDQYAVLASMVNRFEGLFIPLARSYDTSLSFVRVFENPDVKGGVKVDMNAYSRLLQ